MKKQNLQVCVIGDLNDAIVKRTYLEAFPNAAERFPLEDYGEYVASGDTHAYATKFGDRTVSTIISEDLGEVGELLSYVWTDEPFRNQGIGGELIDAFRQAVDARKAGAIIFLEVEDPEEEGISDEEWQIRHRRMRYYMRRHGAQRWTGRYIMPNLLDKRKSGVAGWLMAITVDASAVTHEQFVNAAVHILTNSYGVSATHRYVRLLESQR
jgi:GNAT superfamily N-acetyltransferase